MPFYLITCRPPYRFLGYYTISPRPLFFGFGHFPILDKGVRVILLGLSHWRHARQTNTKRHRQTDATTNKSQDRLVRFVRTLQRVCTNYQMTMKHDKFGNQERVHKIEHPGSVKYKQRWSNSRYTRLGK